MEPRWKQLIQNELHNTIMDHFLSFLLRRSLAPVTPVIPLLSVNPAQKVLSVTTEWVVNPGRGDVRIGVPYWTAELSEPFG